MRQIMMAAICILAGIIAVNSGAELGWFVCAVALLLSKISSQLDSVNSKLNKK